MKSKYPVFDRSMLRMRPLAERTHGMDVNDVLPLDTPIDFEHPCLEIIARNIREACDRGAARILMMGAHVIKVGVSRHVIDLLEQGVLTHIAMSGASAIHDYELAHIGATTESVAHYIRRGEFGLWEETGILNDWVTEAARLELGLGENIGRRILDSDCAHQELSILAAAYRLSIPVTVHVGIGHDIIHEHANCDGGALGASSYRDFLIFAHAVEQLEGGLMLNIGSAVMGPEVYLKALSMARNVANQRGRQIRNFVTAVFDLVPIEGDYHNELPKSDPGYYFRPHKTILVRTVADGGRSFYLCGDHRKTLPALRASILDHNSR